MGLALVLGQAKLTFPPNVVCLDSGTGPAVFTIASPIIIDLQGSCISLVNDTDQQVPTTTSLFRFAPQAAGSFRRWRLANGVIAMNGLGNHIIEIDTTFSPTTEIAEFEIDHISDSPTGNASGYSIFVNNIAANANGGTFNCNFHDNVLQNGIYLQDAGDSIRIRDNLLSGSKYGIYASLINGAAGLIISGNNISAAVPIVIDSAADVMIRDNEIEQQLANPSGVVVNINGGIGTIVFATMSGNSINSLVSGERRRFGLTIRSAVL